MTKEEIKNKIAMKKGEDSDADTEDYEDPLGDGKKYILVTKDFSGLGFAIQQEECGNGVIIKRTPQWGVFF